MSKILFKKLILVAITIALLAISKFAFSDNEQLKKQAKDKLEKAKVISLYENITDGVFINRPISETIKLLKETHTDFIFRGFFKWSMLLEAPEDIPLELIEFARKNNLENGLRELKDAMQTSGYYYRRLREDLGMIKKAMPDVVFCAALAAQRINQIEYDPISGKIFWQEHTWEMALDPEKWNILYEGKPLTKENFQRWFAGFHQWGKPNEDYDWYNAEAYFPDITNSDYQKLLINWAKKLIDCGVDAIWIDGLPQAGLIIVELFKADVNHPAILDFRQAACKIVDEIHKYGLSKGKYIYVGAWPEVYRLIDQLPGESPDFDFVTITPSEDEILDNEIDLTSWAKKVNMIKINMNVETIFSFIDWSFDESPLKKFSQKLTKQKQSRMLRLCDESFGHLGVNFIYPLHGGYMGNVEYKSRLAFGKYRIYDSLAPEFETYATIKELAQKKSEGK